jgi:hypothetical protein
MRIFCPAIASLSSLSWPLLVSRGRREPTRGASGPRSLRGSRRGTACRPSWWRLRCPPTPEVGRVADAPRAETGTRWCLPHLIVRSPATAGPGRRPPLRAGPVPVAHPTRWSTSAAPRATCPVCQRVGVFDQSVPAETLAPHGCGVRTCARTPQTSGSCCGASDHLLIFVTRPAPTVRPPSRMANCRPSSMAIGWISSTVISVLSPGMTISVPSGRVTTPVTSVVRK